MNSKGFTLIELLVVITIIGILASVVLISFPGAVSKAKDARIISSMGQLRIQSRISFVNNGDYSDLNCTQDPDTKVWDCTDDNIESLYNDIQENSDEDFIMRINTNKEDFCAVAHLPGSKKYFCIDSSLRAKEYDSSPAADGNKCDENCVSANTCACE